MRRQEGGKRNIARPPFQTVSHQPDEAGRKKRRRGRTDLGGSLLEGLAVVPKPLRRGGRTADGGRGAAAEQARVLPGVRTQRRGRIPSGEAALPLRLPGDRPPVLKTVSRQDVTRAACGSRRLNLVAFSGRDVFCSPRREGHKMPSGSPAGAVLAELGKDIPTPACLPGPGMSPNTPGAAKTVAVSARSLLAPQ